MVSNSNYPVSFYFSLSIQGEELAFAQVSGISKELTLEKTEGGEVNELSTTSKYQNLILSRPVEVSNSNFQKWCDQSIDSEVQADIKTENIVVNLLGANGKPVISWTFYAAYPVKYSISDLNSMENSLVIETFELTYASFKSSR